MEKQDGNFWRIQWEYGKILINAKFLEERLNDTFEYNLEKREWSVIAPAQGAEVPSPRDCHSAVLYKDRYFVIHAGGDGFRCI